MGVTSLADYIPLFPLPPTPSHQGRGSLRLWIYERYFRDAILGSGAGRDWPPAWGGQGPEALSRRRRGFAGIPGMELEIMVRKNVREAMMKRNKRTEIMGHEELNPLTEQILAQMGPAGADIRKRLKIFYRQRASKNPAPFEEHLEETG